MTLKYRIAEMIGQLPKAHATADLLKTHKIPVRTFQRDKSIERGSKTAIPSDRLLAYAKIFGCSMEQLYTQQKLQKRNKNITTSLS